MRLSPINYTSLTSVRTLPEKYDPVIIFVSGCMFYTDDVCFTLLGRFGNHNNMHSSTAHSIQTIPGRDEMIGSPHKWYSTLLMFQTSVPQQHPVQQQQYQETADHRLADGGSGGLSPAIKLPCTGKALESRHHLLVVLSEQGRQNTGGHCKL